MEWDKEFLDKVRDLAAIGLTPPQIATRLGLRGDDRRRFYDDILRPLPASDLRTAYIVAHDMYEEDLDASLMDSCMTGDAKALKLAYELRKQDSIDAMKMKLFGI